MSPHILAWTASHSLCSVLPVIRLSQCKGRWYMSLCNFPHLKPLFPLSRKCNEICENLLSWYLPLSLLPSLLRPLAVPRSPSTPPFALRSVCFEPLGALGLESELCINLFGPFICTRPTLRLRQAWSVQDLLMRLPWGIPGVWSHLPWCKKKTPSLGIHMQEEWYKVIEQ